VITPRRTRLIRVPDLHAFRRLLSVLWEARAGADPESSLVILPTQGAARQLHRTRERAGSSLSEEARANLVTRDQLYERLHARLARPPRRLTLFEREAIAQAAAVEASTGPGPNPPAAEPSAEPGSAGDGTTLPFRLRPGLVAEILRFYDQLRRQSQQAGRFAELIEEAVGAPAPVDVGAERILQQTRFLASTFRGYERRVFEANACDEHVLRDRLIAEPINPPLRHIIVSVQDWIADPDGLFAADFDLLARLPGVEAIDIVCTEALLGSGFHERLHNWWPGLEETNGVDIAGSLPQVRPVLLTPEGGDPDQLWFTLRDREEELLSIVGRIQADSSAAVDRQAVVYKRPLPYLYLAPETFGAAAISYQTSDALPLAAEPTAAAVDLVLDLVETSFSRDAIVALFRSPHYCFESKTGILTRQQVSALDRGLSDARYLGELPRLEALAARWTVAEALPALELALDVARELAPLLERAPASGQIRRVLAFIGLHARALDAADPFEPRERRARSAIAELLGALAFAREAHDDEMWTISDLAAAVRRWVQEETFAPVSSAAGVHLIDDQGARYGDFDGLSLVGLVESEWPERPRRNIFYSPSLLKSLGWPTEKDRRAAADARFLDLLGSASRQVRVSTITLDDESLVMRSSQLDEIPRARLSTVRGPVDRLENRSSDKATAEISASAVLLDDPARDWAAVRRERPPAASPEFHGSVGRQETRAWSVSALETYLGCPFKFFAQHMLRLDEEPDDEEIMDPRRQGQLLHDVFEAFFAQWQKAGRGAITPGNLDEARAMFTAAVDHILEQLPDAEAGLERTRLLGSSAAAGLGEAVLRMEAERPVAVVERLLEHRLEGAFSIATASGPRVVAVRGKADRLDLLEDGTFRLIDYKLGWPPDRGRALQLPIYGICAEQRLATDRGRQWRLGEAAYLAFKGPKRVVPIFTTSSQRDEVLAKAQQRLADTLDAIERGEFPPAPDDVHRCETCSFVSVCRKDYVGDL
jgi:RecB family exonuclease